MAQRTHGNKGSARWGLIVLWLGSLLILGGNRCSAQGLSKEEKEHKERRAKIGLILMQGPAFGTDWQEILTEYYKGKFDEWIKPDNLVNLVNYRRDLLLELRKANNEEAYSFVVNLILEQHLTPLAEKGNATTMVPVRINAILMIGDINAKGSPLPSPKTIPVLVSLFEKEDLADGARMAVLVGLANHARTPNGLGQEALGNRTLKLLGELARGKTPPAQRPAEVHDWFRIRALEVLAGVVGSRSGTMISFMAEIVRDKDHSSLPVRIAAAQAMGMLARQNVPPEKDELPNLLELVATLGAEAFRAELERHPDLFAENEARPDLPIGVMRPGTGPGLPAGDAPGGRRPGGKTPAKKPPPKAPPQPVTPAAVDSQLLLFRRSLRSQMASIRLGVWCDSPRAGLRVLVEDKRLAGDLNAWFNNVLRATEKPNKEEVLKALRFANTTLENALKGMKMDGTELFRQLSEIDSVLRKAEAKRPDGPG